MLEHKLPEFQVHEIIGQAVQVEMAFISESIPVELIGMNAKLMCEYIKYVADRLLLQLGCSKLYHATNPFNWMEMISLNGKTNFFEKRVGDYAKASISNSMNSNGDDSNAFVTDADF